MQSKIESLLEKSLDTISGFILSVLLFQFIIIPMYNLNSKSYDSIEIVLMFTIVSIIRGYMWRRVFNAKLKKRIKQNE